MSAFFSWSMGIIKFLLVLFNLSQAIPGRKTRVVFFSSNAGCLIGMALLTN